MKLEKYLRSSPVFALNHAYEAVVSRINSELRKSGLNLLQGLVLTALFFDEGQEIIPSQLASLFKTTRGNMSHILSHLESKGLIKRILNPQDARQFFIQLRPEGKRRAIELIKFFDRLQSRFEKKQGTAACEKMTSTIFGLVDVYKSVDR